MRFSLEQYIGLSNVWGSYLKQSWEESGGNLCDGHFVGIFFIIILNLLSLLIPKLVRHVKAELFWLQPSAHTTAASVRTEEFFFGSGIGKARLLHSLTLLPSLGEQLCIQTKQKAMSTNPHADLSASPCVHRDHQSECGYGCKG